MAIGADAEEYCGQRCGALWPGAIAKIVKAEQELSHECATWVWAGKPYDLGTSMR